MEIRLEPNSAIALGGHATLLPDSYPESGNDMRFRLTYEGQLLGASKSDTRAKHKHEIRRVFHRQLKRLWDIVPHLAEVKQPLKGLPIFQHGVPDNQHEVIQSLANRFKCGDFRLVPLVRSELQLTCELDILFLRPDAPGAVLASGDIDNRLKTLFDALRIPGQDSQEVAGCTPQDGEDPLFCLLQDDKLITRVSLETDTLLQPTDNQLVIYPNDARLVISVTVRPANILIGNLNYV